MHEKTNMTVISTGISISFILKFCHKYEKPNKDQDIIT